MRTLIGQEQAEVCEDTIGGHNSKRLHLRKLQIKTAPVKNLFRIGKGQVLMERSHVFIRISICFLDHLTNARFGRRCSGSSLTHKNARRAQSLVCRIIRSSRATLYGYLDNGPAFHLQRIIVNEHRHVGPNGVSRHICDPLNHQVGRGNANHSAIISNSYIDGTAAGIGKGNDILPDTF